MSLLMHPSWQRPAQPYGDAVALQLMAAQARAIAHDIGNPLSGLSLSFELLEQAADAAAQARYLERCRQACDRLLALHETLRAMGCASAEAMRTFDVRALLHDCMKRSVGTQADAPTVVIAPSATQALARPTQLAVCIQELLRNAAQAARPNDAAHRIGIEAACDERAWMLTVWDNGVGIADDVAPLLFRQPVPPQPARLGLGLLRVALVVERFHGGEVAFRARAGGGSEIRIALPRVQADGTA